MIETASGVNLARIKVRGVVQGVGFRPFIYRLAHMYHLAGWVRNTSGSVDIEVEGTSKHLRSFLADIQTKAPPQTRIEHIEVSYHPQNGLSPFTILDSEVQVGKYQLVSPDIATCPDCRREISSAHDRRYRYPFTNCTNCGPRFTIIEGIPYDRTLTTMSRFRMCPECQREYDDPLDRRFHAQPNACPTCGPKLTLADRVGQTIPCDDIIAKTGELLREGKVIAIRGLGGFQLVCDATNNDVVTKLRVKKRRPAKPFAIMLANIASVKEHCRVIPAEESLLQSPEAPIVLLQFLPTKTVCAELAPGNRYLGVMLPYTPLHHLIVRAAGIPLVMTSGNLSEEPIAKDNAEALVRLRDIADFFILHNREIYARYDDSVTMVEANTTQVIRRARGYAPSPIKLPYISRQILACGAEEKNTFCLTRDDYAFLSQHIGNLENEETLNHFENTIELYQRLFCITPKVIAYDMHPDYLSTKYAIRLASNSNLLKVPIQHHHAHIISCLVENRISVPVIGVAFDGTGYGIDGHIWGGEFLIAEMNNFRRVAHLEYLPLPGGAAAIKKPFRTALGYIFSLLGEDFDLSGLAIAKYASHNEIIKQQLRKQINSPFTSSAGRLFDTVAALLGIRTEISYESQAAIELEMIAADVTADDESYPFNIELQNGTLIIKLVGVIAAVITDVRNSIPLPVISLRFHRTVARLILTVCHQVRQDTGLSRVALSGGVFQNRLLQNLVYPALRSSGFETITHHNVPCNDGGIALGQATIAHHTIENKGV